MLDGLRDTLRDEFDIELSQALLLCDTETAQQLQLGTAHTRELAEARQHIPNLLDMRQAYCGTLRDTEKQFLFGEAAAAIGSAAICTRTIGGDTAALVFAVTHREQAHYGSETGTLFVEYLADVLQGILQSKLH